MKSEALSGLRRTGIPDAFTRFIDSVERFFGPVGKIVDLVFGFISKLPAWVFLAVVLAPPVLFGFLYLRWWFRRRARWEQAAILSGFTPLDEKASLCALFPRLSVFAADTDSDAETLWGCEGSSGGKKVWLADFNSRFANKSLAQTVAVLRVPGAAWPELTLRERKGGMPRRRTGEELSDVDFDRTFRAEGPDADVPRKLLSRDARAGLVRLAARCQELEGRADTPGLRLVLRVANQVGRLQVELAGDVVAVCARRCLDPAVARDLPAAVEEACSALSR